MDRKVVAALRQLPERQSLRARLAHLRRFKQIGLQYERAARLAATENTSRRSPAWHGW